MVIYYHAIFILFAEPRCRVMIQTNDVNHNSWPFGKNGKPCCAAGDLIRFSKTCFRSREFSVFSFSVDGFPWDMSSLKETVMKNGALFPFPFPDVLRDNHTKLDD